MASDRAPPVWGLVVMVTLVGLIAALTFSLEYGALAYPAMRPPEKSQLGMFGYQAMFWVFLTSVCVVAQGIAAARWAAWTQSVADRLESVGAPGIERGRFGSLRTLLRPGETTGELLAISRGAASWTGAWVPERRAVVIRVWSTAWTLRLIASLGAVVLVSFGDQPSALAGGLVYVLCMLRDLALTVAAPALLLTVLDVHAELARASEAANGRGPLGLVLRDMLSRVLRVGLTLASFAAVIVGVSLVGAAIDAPASTHAGFWAAGVIVLLLAPALAIAAQSQPDREAPAA